MASLSADLNGKAAAVTGGGNGIGKACAIAFMQNGAEIALIDYSEAALEQAKKEIEGLGGKCRTYVCDVTKVSQIHETFQRIEADFGHIDILLNSAGVNVQQRGEDVTEEAWDKVINTNAKGSFFCCQAAGKVMIKQNSGSIINLGSAMSVVGYERRSSYCASKGAVAQFTKVLAGEWAKYNITVNTVAPTFIYTPFTAPMFENEAFHEDVKRRILFGRVGEVDDVVGAVLYLASDAAKFVTGSILMVDGGWTAW
jgi:2-deoxy-D-gluconate 3-dehydrogenase